MENTRSFAPVSPTEHYRPQIIGPDTWLIRQVQPALGAPLSVYINSMVISGNSPIIVDTGSPANREQWLQDVFGIVEPGDVRWVFLSHDDIDHAGNLAEVLEYCPKATLVCSWAIVERFTNAFRFPLERCRWLNDGEQLDAGDRVLRAVRPPVYDSPSTRGLLDERTGIYWAADAFATAMPETPVASVEELDATFWRGAHAMFIHHGLSPWLSLVDYKRFCAEVDRVEAFKVNAIASAHCPLIPSGSLGDAFQLTRELLTDPVPPCPDHLMLDSMLRAHAPVSSE
jgi:flavorubredoxin